MLRGIDRGPARPRTLRWAWLHVLAPVLVFNAGLRGRIAMAPGDGYGQYVPWYTQVAESWQQLRLPAWNPFPFAGAPLLAAGQAAAFYPPNLVFAVLPVAIANATTITLTFVIAGTGAFVFAHRLVRDPVAAAVAGFAFGLCGFLFAHVGHQSMIATVAWLPWVLAGFDLVLERRTPLRLLAGSLPVTLALFAGHLQLFTFVCAVLGAYAVVLAAVDVRASRGRPLVAGALVALCGFALAAVQLVPTALYVGLTQRSDIPYETAITYSLPKSHLVLGAFPTLFGRSPALPYTGQWNLAEMTWYPGLLAAALAAAGLARLRADKRLVALAVVAAGLFVVALGPATPVSRLVHALPVYGQFRAWARYLVGVSLVVAVLAAAGVVELRQGGAAARRAAVRAGAVLGAVLLAAVVVPRLDRVASFRPPTASVLAVTAPVVAALLALAAVAIVARRPRLAWALVAFAAVEPVVLFGWHTEWRIAGPTPAQLEEDRGSGRTFWGGVADAPGGIDRFLYVGSDVFPVMADAPAITDWKGLRSANGNDPLTPRVYAEAAAGMTAFGATPQPHQVWDPESRLLDLLRVTTVILHPQSAAGGPPPGSLLRDGRPLAGHPLVRFDHSPALPDAFLVGATEARPRAAVLRALHGEEPFDPAAVALLEEPCDACPDGPAGPAGRVLRTTWGQNTVTVEYEAERPAVLVVSQAYIEGWRASVDGRATPVHRVDGLVKGAPVPSGRHTVTFQYVPPGLRAGGAISGLTLVGLLGWAALDRRRGRNDRTPAAQEQEQA